MTGKSFEGGSRWGRAAGIQPWGHEGTQNPQGRDWGEHSNARDASARRWASKEHEILVKINSQSIIPLKRHVPEDEAITKDLAAFVSTTRMPRRQPDTQQPPVEGSRRGTFTKTLPISTFHPGFVFPRPLCFQLALSSAQCSGGK